MVYEAGDRQFEVIGEISQYRENGVLVCQDLLQNYSRYTVWQVKEHHKAKQILNELYQEKDSCCLECFAYGADSFFVFPHREVRSLQRFFFIQADNKEKKKQIYQSVVLSCISNKLPCSILYLVLMQNQININSQGEIYFTLDVDLSQWNKQKNEAACVQVCAEKLFFFLEQGDTWWEKELYRLLKKKTERGAYQKFTELYRDICLVEAEPKKKRKWWISSRAKHRIVRILFMCCGVLAMLAVIIFVSQLIWGEVPLFHLFEPYFTKIGTESLLQ